jgi:hypothetical protein
MNKLIIKGLFKIVKIVREFDYFLISNYDLQGKIIENVDIAFPKSGTYKIKNMLSNYTFHGSGCYIEKFNLDFQYNLENKNAICISVFYFTKFLKFNFEDDQLNSINQNAPIAIEIILEQLVELRLLAHPKYANKMFEINEEMLINSNISNLWMI